MKNKKLSKSNILSLLGGAAILTATSVTVASCASNIAVEKSIVTSDVDEINIVAGVGEPQQIKFNGTFYDINNNEVKRQVKFLTNLDVINYYGDLPKDLLTFSDDGVLTVDPKKCTDQLLDATWQINVWAQTTNDKLIAEQMIKKTIKINCKHDDSVPRYAKITSQSDNCVTLACGSDQGEKEVKFDITYWSSIEGEYSFDNTIWSVTDRGDLPETCDLSFKNGETLGEGILTIDAQNCTLATNQVYNIKVQGQSTKCPSVVASANLEINLTGDVTPTEATILGSETVEVDPNAPSTYKFDYSCRVTNQGDETIDNSPLRWTLNEKQVKTLSDAGIDVEFKNNQLLVNTINCKSKEQQDYSLLLTATSLIDNTVEDSLPIDISVNKFDNTPANVELGGDANIFAKAGEEDDISVTFAPYVSNASHAKIDSITQGYNLTLAPDSEQSSKFAQSGIKHWMDGNILNLNTKDINIDYKQLQTNFTIKLIGNYSASGISFQTEHFLSLKVNPMNDEVVSSMTLAATTTTSARGVLGQKVSTNTPTFNPKLLNPSGVPLVRYQPVLTAEATPELPDGVNISFDANDDYRMIIDATNCSSLTDKNFKVEVSCKAYYDGETQKTVTPAKDNGSVTIDLTLTDTKNVIKLVNDNVIELKDFCNPNELCGIREGGVYWFHVTNKAGQIQEVSSNTIKEINIGFCDPSISAIGDNFLAGCTYLEKVDFTGLNNVFAVGNKTLYGCQSLAEIDLSPIEQLTTIGNEFMSSCTRIMNFKMTGLHKIRNIGSNFMNNCSMLQTVDLSAITDIKSIGGNMLFDCYNLQKVNMGSIAASKVTAGNAFAFEASEEPTSTLILEVLNKDEYENKFPNIWQDGIYRNLNIQSNANYVEYNGIDYILADNLNPNLFCGEIFALPLKDATQLEGGMLLVGTSILKSALTKIVLRGVDQNVTIIGDGFLYECNAIETFDFEGLENVISIGKNFLAGCTKLKSVDLSIFKNIKGKNSIGDGFAYKCTNLINVNLGSIPASAFNDNVGTGELQTTLVQTDVKTKAFSVGVYIEGEQANEFVGRFANIEGNESRCRYLMTTELNTFMVLDDATKGLTHYVVDPDYTIDINSLCGSETKSTIDLPVNGVTKKVKHTDLLSISLRGQDNVICSNGAINNYFLCLCKEMHNVYIRPMPEVESLGHHFLAYGYALQSFDFSAFPNLEFIDTNYFMGKCWTLTSLDFSPIETGDKLIMQALGKETSNAMFDCYNLIMVNFGKIKVDHIVLNQDFQFMAIRNNLPAFAFVLGCQIKGDDAEAIVSRFRAEVAVQNFEGPGEDTIEISAHALGFKDWIIIWVRNLTVSTNSIVIPI